MRRALASLGAPPTSPPAAIDADALYARCEADFMGGYSGPLYDAFKHGMWTVCNVLRSTRPTSPPAARPVFAGVSASDLDVTYLHGHGECHRAHGVAIRDCCRWAGIRAVLARLEVSLVAPVDPEAVAREVYDDTAWRVGLTKWRDLPETSQEHRIAAMRTALESRGVPTMKKDGAQ